MTNEKQTAEEVENLKRERAATKADAEAAKSKDGASGAKGKGKTTRRRRSRAQVAEDTFPIEHWRKVSDFVLDGATAAANTAQRTTDEKEAFALTGLRATAARVHEAPIFSTKEAQASRRIDRSGLMLMQSFLTRHIPWHMYPIWAKIALSPTISIMNSVRSQ